MKKILNCFLIAFPFLLFAQVGIGRNNPRGALDVNNGSGVSPHGLVLPTNNRPNLIQNPQGGGIAPGTMFYDSEDDCIKLRTGNSWSNCLGECACEDPGLKPIEPECADSYYITNPNPSDEIFITSALSTSLAAYNNAAVGDPVFITEQEYENLGTYEFRQRGHTSGIEVTPQNTFTTSGGTFTYARQNTLAFGRGGGNYTALPPSKKITVFGFAINTNANNERVQFAFARWGGTGGWSAGSSNPLLNILWKSKEVKIPNSGPNYIVFKSSAVTIKNLAEGDRIVLGHNTTGLIKSRGNNGYEWFTSNADCGPVGSNYRNSLSNKRPLVIARARATN